MANCFFRIKIFGGKSYRRTTVINAESSTVFPTHCRALSGECLEPFTGKPLMGLPRRSHALNKIANTLSQNYTDILQ